MDRNAKLNGIKAMLKKDGIDFENDFGWSSILGQIEAHNKELDERLKFSVEENDALFSWYENIYTPVKRAIMNGRVKRAFRGLSTGEIFLKVSEHWMSLPENGNYITADIAAHDLIHRNKKSKTGFSGMFNSGKPSGGMPVVRHGVA